MERHSAQKFRINGKACNCGSEKHLLDLEELCEETIPMVDENAVYYKIIELGKEIAPKAIPEVVATGKYDKEFPIYSGKYRDLRKELLGTLDYSVLFEKKETEQLETKETLELPEGKTEGTPAELIPDVLNPEDERKELLARGVVI